MANRWFRVYNEIIDDEKIRLLAFEDRWHFVAILALKSAGFFDKDAPGSDLFRRRLAVKLGVAVLDLDNLHKRLAEVGLIDADWQPIAWDRRQFLSDADPTAAERARRYRERRSNGAVTRDVTDESRTRHTPQTQIQTQTTDTDSEADSEGREVAAGAAPVATATPPCPHDAIVELFNTRCTAMPRVRELTDHRRKAIRARWRENPDRQSIEWWRLFFDRVASSPFLCGANERHWTADFDWLLKPSNLVKVAEGKYDVAGPRIFSDRTQRNIENLREWANGSA